MAQFYTGDQDVISSFAHGETHPGTARFLEEMISQPTHAIGEASQALMQQSSELYDRFMGSDAVRRIRAAGRQIASHWQRNEILPLDTVEQLQVAPLKMRRWLMAEPTVRALYQKRQCDGYSSTYVDAAPGFIGENHEDYQRVMDGIVVEGNDNSDHAWVSTEYMYDLPEDENEFIFDQQFDIIRSWHSMAEAVMAKKDDPTSEWNAEL